MLLHRAIESKFKVIRLQVTDVHRVVANYAAATVIPLTFPLFRVISPRAYINCKIIIIGNTNNQLSKRSYKPPCPGKILPESLTSQ